MKKKLIILGVTLLLTVGCGNRIPQLQNGEDAVVTFGNGEMISVDAFYEHIKNSFGLQALLQMIDRQILEAVYEDYLEEAWEQAENFRVMLETQFGDAALTTVQQQGFSTWEALLNHVYVSDLQNRAIQDFAKGRITDRQIKNHYRDEIEGDIRVSHILITPDVVGTMSTEERDEAEAAAQRKAEGLIRQLRDVNTNQVADKFAELAREYSDDTATGANGGDMGWINKNTPALSEGYRDFIREAYNLSNGAFTRNVVQSDLGFHVILRVDSREKPSLEAVRDQIIETLSSQLIENDATVPIRAMQQLRRDHGVEFIDSELQRQYAAFIQNAIANAEERNRENE